MKDIAEEGEIGLTFGIGRTYQYDGLMTAEAIDEVGAVETTHRLEVCGLKMHRLIVLKSCSGIRFVDDRI